MYFSSADLKYFSLAISNKETEEYSVGRQFLDKINDDDLKYAALAITNNETEEYTVGDQFLDKISDDDLKYAVLAITNNETEEYTVGDQFLDKISDDVLKYAVLAITNNETEEYTVGRQFLDKLGEDNPESDIDDDDDDDDETETNITREKSENTSSRYSDNSSENDYSDYSNDSSSYDAKSTSKSNSTIGLLIIIMIIVAGWFLYSKQKSDNPSTTNNSSQSSPVSSSQSYNTPTTQIQEPVSTNPYGEGNGRASFYRTSILGDNTEVYFEDSHIGTINEIPWSDATCSGQGTFSVNIPAGIRLFIYKDEEGQMWKEYINIVEGDCILVKVTAPEIVDKNNDGLSDRLTEIYQESVPDAIKNSGSGRSIVCPQCNGNGQRELNAYCKVCTHYGLGGVAFLGYVNCPDCNGNGTINNSTCMTCRQTGQVKCSNCAGEGRAFIMFKCNLCSGDGKISL